MENRLVDKIIIKCENEQEFLEAQRYLFQFDFEWWYCNSHPLKKYVVVEWEETASEMHIIAEIKTKWLSASCYRAAVGHSGEAMTLNQLKNSNLLIKNYKGNNLMSTITSLIKKIARQEPEKTFVEVGFMDENENITEDGKEALIQVLWNDNKTKLKELADKLNEATKPSK